MCENRALSKGFLRPFPHSLEKNLTKKKRKELAPFSMHTGVLSELPGGILMNDNLLLYPG